MLTEKTKYNGRDKENKKAMARGKGTKLTPNGATNRKSASRFSARKSEATNADYGGINASLIREAIDAVTALGGAIRFGYTSDGGAYAVGIYDGDERFTEYFRSDDEVSEYLRTLAGTAGDDDAG